MWRPVIGLKCSAVATGLNIRFEPITKDGQPAFLEWHELQAKAEEIVGTVSEQQPVLKADAARQFFDDVYRAINAAPALRRMDDSKIILFNKVIDLARLNRSGRIPGACARAGMSPRGTGKVMEAISWYKEKVETNEFSGPAVARGYPQHAESFHVYLHNCLYEQPPLDGEFREDATAEAQLRPGQYDLVIGNPPGNDEYSGTNREAIVQLWQERFGHTEGGLMDHHCFIRRAVELARPDGGRICMLVPEGLLARDNRGIPSLRYELMQQCELQGVISLPRVFKNNNARMAVLYLVRNPRWNRRRKVLMASVLPDWTDENGEKRITNLYAELETIVDRYRSEVERDNSRLAPGSGLKDFPETSSVAQEQKEE